MSLLSSVVDVALVLLGASWVVLGAFLAAQLWAAPRNLGRSAAASMPPGGAPRLAIVIPAHDEAAGIAATLVAVRAEVAPDDRVVVVADNCSDDTARIARAHGAEVVERVDPVRRGKGYALEAGVRALAEAPPEVVVFLDADCIPSRGALPRVAASALQHRRPVQALYLMEAPVGAPLGTRLAAFAWIVKNGVRPAGAGRLGLPCQLTGSGMALPWPLASTAPLASGHLVEDMELGLRLAETGHAPHFCADATVTSRFPTGTTALRTQRARWEHGHVRLALGGGVPSLWHALRTGNGPLAVLALDLMVPPLALWLLMAALLAVAAAAWYASTQRPAGLAIAVLLVVVVGGIGGGLLRAWARHARTLVAGRELLLLPWYVLRKLPLYGRLLGRAPATWIRTGRDAGRR